LIRQCRPYIIYQQVTKSPVSEQTGRMRLKQAAQIRNDIVKKRIERMMEDDEDGDSCMFVYQNTNSCYKTNTHSRKLKSIEDRSEEPMVCQPEDVSASFEHNLCSFVTPCAPPSCNKDPKKLPCVICENIEHNTCREKFRICEYGSARKLIDAAEHN